MTPWVAELFGTMLLVLLGNRVVANMVLRNTRGSEAGWIVITAGWGMAVFVAVLCTAPYSGAHINPARDLGLRIMHQLLPIRGKGDSDWGYAWVPVVGPLVGGCWRPRSTLSWSGSEALDSAEAQRAAR